MRRIVSVIAAGALAAAGSACFSRGGATSRNVLAAAAVSGSVLVRSAAGAAWAPLGEGDEVPAGAQVRTPAGGDVAFTGDDAVEIELGPTTTADVTTGRSIRLLRGSALLRTERAPAVVESDDLTVRAGSGAMRVDRALSTRVGVYEGSATAASHLVTITIPRLREIVVAGGTLPRAVRPLSLRETDRWDRRFLSDALDLDQALRSFGRGFDAQYGTATKSAILYRRFVTLRDVSFLQPYASSEPGSDVLIGLVMALAAGGPLEGTYASFYDLHRDGASWGLIAAEHGLRSVDVLSYLNQSMSGGVTPTLRPVAGAPNPGPAPQGSAAPARRATRPANGTSASPDPSDDPNPNGDGGGDGGDGGSSPPPQPPPAPSEPAPSPSPTPCGLLDPLLNPACGQKNPVGVLDRDQPRARPEPGLLPLVSGSLLGISL